MSFKPYPKYKESGIEWLGEVPEHWEVVRLKHCARLMTTKADSRNNPVALENIEGWTGRLIPSEGDYQGDGTAFGSGDILFGKLRPYLAKVHLAEQPGEAVGDFHVLRPGKNLDGRFAQYRMLTREFIDIVDGSTYGSKMPRASWEFVGAMPMALPPLSEQPRITRFLDHETAKIAALIAEQQRLIELLQEKRQAVISHAVTKGLNPDAPMKDSGIEWLGEVPEHWATPPVFVRYEAVLGKMVDEKKATGSHPVPYLRNADVYWDQVNTTDLPTLDIQPHERTRFSVRKGDVLICEGGAGIGQTAIWQGEDDTTAFQKALHRLRPWDTTKEDPRYFFYCMRFAVESGRLLAGGTATIPHLTGEQLRRYRFPCPPLREQQAIVQFLDEDGRQIDALQESATRAITLLQERRSALISAAVTGQIDVREFAGGSEAA